MAENGDGIDAADLTIRAVSAEVGAVLRLSDRTVQRRIADASLTVERFPLVWAAQGSGRTSAGHARVIVDAGAHLDDAESRAAYSERVLEFAEDESPNRLRPIAARIAEHYQPTSLEERHTDAREQRGVWVKDVADGMPSWACSARPCWCMRRSTGSRTWRRRMLDARPNRVARPLRRETPSGSPPRRNPQTPRTRAHCRTSAPTWPSTCC
jgi:hypothetical protein